MPHERSMIAKVEECDVGLAHALCPSLMPTLSPVRKAGGFRDRCGLSQLRRSLLLSGALLKGGSFLNFFAYTWAFFALLH